MKNGALGSEWEKEVFGIKEDSEGSGTPAQVDGSSFRGSLSGEEDAEGMQEVPGMHEMHLGFSVIILLFFPSLPSPLAVIQV